MRLREPGGRRELGAVQAPGSVRSDAHGTLAQPVRWPAPAPPAERPMEPPPISRATSPAVALDLHPEVHSALLRLLGFGVGGALSYGLNLGAFVVLHEWHSFDQGLAYAISLTLVTGVNFTWSYFVNFRTDATIRACLPRYAATLLSCYVLNYTLAQAGFAWWPETEKLVILGALVLAAGVKFVIYHLWVFPRRQRPQDQEQPVGAA